MGFKKKMAYGLLKQVTSHPNFRSYLKKGIIIAVILGILLFILMILLIGFGISILNKIVSNYPDNEIVSLLRQLIQIVIQ